jgi:hypothetical protein
MILLHVTTPQDLLADLGSPASIYYKEEDKMKIHSEKESPRVQQEEDGILGEMDDIGYDRTNKPAEGRLDTPLALLLGPASVWLTCF